MLTNQPDDKEKKIFELETQIEVLQRKLDNSKILVSTSEKFARLAQEREAKATNRSRKVTERLDDIETRLQIKRLQNACDGLNEEIGYKEKRISEIQCNEFLSLPVKTDDRRRLQRFKQEVQESKKLRDGQGRLLSSLIGRQNQIEEMRNAATKGDLDNVQRLLKVGTSVNIPDEGGICAFKYACGQGNLNIVKEMIGVADVNNTEGGCPPLQYAVKCNQAEVVHFLLQNNAKVDELDGCVPSLHVACKHGYQHIFNLLVEYGADINKANKFGDTCLHILSNSNSESSSREEMVSRLLELGADFENVKNLAGLTPYVLAKTQRLYGVLRLFKETKKLRGERLG